jgi:hypothetical protein
MSSKGWFNLEAVGGTIPETQFFEGDSAFSSLGLTRTQRLYGFAAWYVVVVVVVVVVAVVPFFIFVMSGFFHPPPPYQWLSKGLGCCSVAAVAVGQVI